MSKKKDLIFALVLLAAAVVLVAVLAFMAGAIITAILMKKHFKNQNDKRM